MIVCLIALSLLTTSHAHAFEIKERKYEKTDAKVVFMPAAFLIAVKNKHIGCKQLDGQTVCPVKL